MSHYASLWHLWGSSHQKTVPSKKKKKTSYICKRKSFHESRHDYTYLNYGCLSCIACTVYCSLASKKSLRCHFLVSQWQGLYWQWQEFLWQVWWWKLWHASAVAVQRSLTGPQTGPPSADPCDGGTSSPCEATQTVWARHQKPPASLWKPARTKNEQLIRSHCAHNLWIICNRPK